VRVRLHDPDGARPEHVSLPPLAVTVTVPPGAPASELTLKPTSTLWPELDGFGSWAVICVLVAAFPGVTGLTLTGSDTAVV
jgi:hypothetical protein